RGEAQLDAAALAELNARERLVDSPDADVGAGVAVSVDLSGSGPDRLVGYRAKRHTGLIDVERRGGYAVAEFWEPIAAREDASLILDPNEFYILSSKEAGQGPPAQAPRVVAVRPVVGEVSRHLARF